MPALPINSNISPTRLVITSVQVGATSEVKTTFGGLTAPEVGEREEVEAAEVMEEMMRDRTALTEGRINGAAISSSEEVVEASITDPAAPAPEATVRPTEEALTGSSLTPAPPPPLALVVTSTSLVTWGLLPGATRPMFPSIKA